MIDWQQTIIINWLWKMLRWWKKNKKQQILCPLSSRKSSLLRAPTFISEKIIDSQQTIMIKLIGKNKAFVSKSHLSTLLLKVVVQKNTRKVPQITFFTVRTSLVQKLFALLFVVVFHSHDWWSTIDCESNDWRSTIDCGKVYDSRSMIYDRDRIAWLMIDDRH